MRCVGALNADARSPEREGLRTALTRVANAPTVAGRNSSAHAATPRYVNTTMDVLRVRHAGALSRYRRYLTTVVSS